MSKEYKAPKIICPNCNSDMEVTSQNEALVDQKVYLDYECKCDYKATVVLDLINKCYSETIKNDHGALISHDDNLPLKE